MKWLQKPVLTTHDVQATAVIVYAFLLRSQGLAFRANNPTKHVVIDETCVRARNWRCQSEMQRWLWTCSLLLYLTALAFFQQDQLNLSLFLAKTFHKSHTSLKFALFS